MADVFDLSASSSRGDEKQKGPGLTAVSLLDSGYRGSAFMIKVKQTGGQWTGQKARRAGTL